MRAIGPSPLPLHVCTALTLSLVGVGCATKADPPPPMSEAFTSEHLEAFGIAQPRTDASWEALDCSVFVLVDDANGVALLDAERVRPRLVALANSGPASEGERLWWYTDVTEQVRADRPPPHANALPGELVRVSSLDGELSHDFQQYPWRDSNADRIARAAHDVFWRDAAMLRDIGLDAETDGGAACIVADAAVPYEQVGRLLKLTGGASDYALVAERTANGWLGTELTIPTLRAGEELPPVLSIVFSKDDINVIEGRDEATTTLAAGAEGVPYPALRALLRDKRGQGELDGVDVTVAFHADTPYTRVMEGVRAVQIDADGRPLVPDVILGMILR